jgi:tetratricopeptide (TPR) repeat protein
MRFLKTLARAFRRPTPPGHSATAEQAAQIALAAYGRLAGGDAAGAAGLIAPLLAQEAGHADVFMVQGLVEKSAGELDAAAACLRKAVALRPDFGAAWAELGAVLAASGQLEEALSAQERAAALEPQSAQIRQNLGMTRYRLRDVSGAVEALEEALALDPELTEARFDLAEALLVQGDFERGWAAYEHRPQLAAAMAKVTMPRWTPQPMAKRVAVIAEQGLGDVVMFARLLPRLRALADEIEVFTQPTLVRLFRDSGLAHDVRVLDELAAVEPGRYDGYLPFMSLARAIELRLPGLDADTLYLRPSAALIETWRTRVRAVDTPGLRVGLAWGGNPGHRRDDDRSIPVAQLAALAGIEGVQLYRLQLGRPDLGAPEFPIVDLTPHIEDLADSAALMHALDLVISVDTAVAHVAGALGRPVWVLCPLRADWRWQIDGRDAPWYASARVFRPDRTAEWRPVIADVAEALTRLARQC